MVAPNARRLDGTVAEDIRFAHAALDKLPVGNVVGGISCHSTYRQDALFSSSFTVSRSPFGVWRSAFGVRRSAYSYSIWLAVRFDAIACPQRLEGSRFAPLQVLAERAEETNPELLDNAASRRLPGTSQRPEYHIRLDNTARSRTRNEY
jgi:hypothetical protein